MAVENGLMCRSENLALHNREQELVRELRSADTALQNALDRKKALKAQIRDLGARFDETEAYLQDVLHQQSRTSQDKSSVQRLAALNDIQDMIKAYRQK